jgi:hypothetical protein
VSNPLSAESSFSANRARGVKHIGLETAGRFRVQALACPLKAGSLKAAALNFLPGLTAGLE